MRNTTIASCLLLSVSVAAGQAPRRYQWCTCIQHDRSAFTEGLTSAPAFLYESTGLNGKSTLRKVKLETGQVLQQIQLDPQYFGEGITLFNQQIFQLTYRSAWLRLHDQATFSPDAGFYFSPAKAGPSRTTTRSST